MIRHARSEGSANSVGVATHTERECRLRRVAVRNVAISRTVRSATTEVAEGVTAIVRRAVSFPLQRIISSKRLGWPMTQRLMRLNYHINRRELDALSRRRTRPKSEESREE